MTTIISRDRATQASGAVVEGDGLWLRLDELRDATGWELKAEGACLDEMCIPLPDAQRDRFLSGEGSETRCNLAALAHSIGQPVLHDAKHDLWYFGTQWSLNGVPLGRPNTPTAPDFTLPDIDGREHSLSDHHGKKVLLVTWASW